MTNAELERMERLLEAKRALNLPAPQDSAQAATYKALIGIVELIQVAQSREQALLDVVQQHERDIAELKRELAGEVKHLRAQLKTITHSTRETVTYLRDLEGALTQPHQKP